MPLTTSERRKLRKRRPAETYSAAVGVICAAAALIFDVELDPVEVAGAVGAISLVAAIVTGIVEKLRG